MLNCAGIRGGLEPQRGFLSVLPMKYRKIGHIFSARNALRLTVRALCGQYTSNMVLPSALGAVTGPWASVLLRGYTAACTRRTPLYSPYIASGDSGGSCDGIRRRYEPAHGIELEF